MLTNNTVRRIEETFAASISFSSQLKTDIIRQLAKLATDEQILMKFLYASMPISDAADYDFTTYLGFVRHALLLKKIIPWCSNMPDDIFLNYVLFYRINNEDIQESRKLFYDSINERIIGKTMTEAALEVNNWCAEKVAYRSTDVRTAAPLTVWIAGSGRCGEESTFAATAMRSVGIPARQIYTPRWSHCDDNHAWVEVWCDGEWHYLGACEPEPVLDRGWFTEAASRAMFIHSRIFSSFTADEEVVGRQGKTTVLNHIERYAKARKFSVKVADRQGKPVPAAIISFEVLNQSEFFQVASKISDGQGKAEITLGLANIRIHVHKAGRFVDCFVDTAQTNQIDICFDEAAPPEIKTQDFKIVVPEGDKSRLEQLTPEQNAQKKQTISNADKIREEKLAGFYKEPEAAAAVSNYSCKEELKEILQKARGNFEEVSNYLNAVIENDNPDLRAKLLMSLSDKDFCDMKSEMLLQHFISAINFNHKYDDSIFCKYIMCPRIHFELLTPYRDFISEYFDEHTKNSFRSNPQLVWNFISGNMQSSDDDEYEELYTSPCGVLQTKYGSTMSKRILFTAVCRTIGVPARLNPVTFLAEYYHAENFITVEKETKQAAKLIIRSLDKTQWLYMQNWTIGVSKNGVYSTLDLTGTEWQAGVLTVNLPAGIYRLLASNRMPNGNLLAREYCFVCEQNVTTEVSIALPEAKTSDLLDRIPYPDFMLSDERGDAKLGKELVGGKPTVIIWLEEGKEPTEHIFNELIDHHKKFIATGCRIMFILRSKNALSNATLQKTLKLGMNISLHYGNFEEDAVAVAKSLYRDSEKLPLVLVTSDGIHALYSSCGYNVGIADLLAKIIKAAG